jgi:transcriptional regulator with XRE-family HTH domain
MSFGERITTLRKNKRWSQTELGDFVGTSRDLIGRYERDEIKPSIEVAAKIAEGLGCSLDYLVRGISETDNLIPPQFVALLSKLEKLSTVDKAHIEAVMEAFIAKSKFPPAIEQ